MHLTPQKNFENVLSSFDFQTLLASWKVQIGGSFSKYHNFLPIYFNKVSP